MDCTQPLKADVTQLVGSCAHRAMPKGYVVQVIQSRRYCSVHSTCDEHTDSTWVTHYQGNLHTGQILQVYIIKTLYHNHHHAHKHTTATTTTTTRSKVWGMQGATRKSRELVQQDILICTVHY